MLAQARLRLAEFHRVARAATQPLIRQRAQNHYHASSVNGIPYFNSLCLIRLSISQASTFEPRQRTICALSIFNAKCGTIIVAKIKFSNIAMQMLLTAMLINAFHAAFEDAVVAIVDDLVKALGMSGISKSQVSRLCEEIDERVKAFLDRPIEGTGPIYGSTPPT
jgi:Transposase, Mutator family